MPCIIGTAGHIDHGKTALVKALTGIDTDRLTEEKKRGVSIDLGFAYLDLKSGDKEKLRAAIVDVPGHERFIKNMLAGVSGIDMVLFCVAADDGVMPQTIEHLDIVRLLGVKRGVFVVTKKDLVTFKRSEEVKKAVRSLISNTALKDAPVVSASTVTGEGIEELKELIGSICTGAGRDVDNKYFRLPVDRSFTVKGFGTVLTGTVASGTVSVGDEVFLFPGGEKLRVRGLESHHEKAERISAGQRGAVNVTGLSYTEAERGFTLTRPDLWRYIGAVKGSLRVDCVFEFTGFADPKGTHPIKRGSGLKFHHMTSDCLASIQFADRKEAQPGESLYGRVYLKRPLLILRGDRFILRDPSTHRTVGGGTALMPYFSRRMMPGMADVPYGSFEKGDLGEILPVLFRKTDLTVDRATLSLMLNVRDKDLKGLLAKTDYEVEAKEVVSLERLRGLKKKVMEIIEIYHTKHPGDLGIAEETIAGELGSRFHPPALKKVMDELVRNGLVVRNGPVVSSASHRPASGGVDAKIEEGIKKAVREGFNPTTMAELEKLPFKKQDLERVLNYLNRRGILIKLTEGVYIPGERLEEARKKLEDHLRDKGKIKAAEFRDLLGCGRKFAIEILEYFDKERLTLRQGDYRILRQA
jgi:selenocysteine-specific elongation factor